MGVQRGPCPFDYGADKDMETYAKAHIGIEVTFTNVRYGEFGSTYNAKSTAEANFELIAAGDAVAEEAPRGPLLAVGALIAAAGLASVAAAVVGRLRARRGSSSCQGMELLPSDAGVSADDVE